VKEDLRKIIIDLLIPEIRKLDEGQRNLAKELEEVKKDVKELLKRSEDSREVDRMLQTLLVLTLKEYLPRKGSEKEDKETVKV